MLDLTLWNMAQQRQEQRKAEENSKYDIKQKRKKTIMKVIGGIALISVLVPGFYIVGKANKKPQTEIYQKYVARYGVTYAWGSVIITDDGNVWVLEDAPEFEDGTEVRVLFDSNRTEIDSDDKIIDVTER